MADLLEIETYPNPENVFYEITSSALSFYVKSFRNAVIGLARKQSHACDYWIVISNYPYSYIKKGCEPRTKLRTLGILSPETFDKFWISWYGGYIRLGRDGESKPFLECANKVPGLKYVTFDIRARRERSPIYWKVELPPRLPKPKFVPIVGGEPYWVSPGNQIPDDAIIGGHENQVLYIIRAPHLFSLTPGKFVPSLGLGYISWGGNAHEKTSFEVLCGHNCSWVPCREDRIPTNAVVGGYAEGEAREKLYVGRAFHEGHLIPGKVQPSHRVCYLPYNNREIPKTFFEILVVPDAISHTVSKTFLYDMECDTGSESDHDQDVEQDENDQGQVENEEQYRIAEFNY